MATDSWKLTNFERVLPLETERAVFDVEFQSGAIVREIQIVPKGDGWQLQNCDGLSPLLHVPVMEAAVIEIRNRPHF
ncbi:hypothetical protein EH240_33510 [Mesorhizobium tamadayense]|uniref:Uncharacterized protein n=1 Tax=Mesorhizobium tamadayense TaxID=425306 RepID=A0A3P3EXI5_9HYPH|nr:hypothetical protein [Mesorhizobium tamadayense]RRH90048.1 hypothetical protein EH240_33510 [Mesorhizobium tamadayense]